MAPLNQETSNFFRFTILKDYMVVLPLQTIIDFEVRIFKIMSIDMNSNINALSK